MAHVQSQLASLEGAPRSSDMHIGDGLIALPAILAENLTRYLWVQHADQVGATFVTPGCSGGEMTAGM